MDTETIDQLSHLLGISLTALPTLAAVTVAVIAVLKERFGLTGRGIDLAVVAIMAALNTMLYQPALKPIIVGTLIGYCLSVGGWAAAKQLASKIGNNR